MLAVSDEKLSKQVLVRLSPSEFDRLQEQARKEGRKVAQLVRWRVLNVGGPGVAEESRTYGGRGHEANVDFPRELHDTELPVVAYAPAGEDRDPQPIATGETIRVANPIARQAQKKHWQVVKIVGDSMTTPDGRGYEDGDFVLVEPSHGENVRDGDPCYVLLNGDPLFKVLRFQKNRAGGKERVTLASLNPRYPPIPVYPSDDFGIVGVEAYHIARKRNFG